jgi:hypothetical protein
MIFMRKYDYLLYSYHKVMLTRETHLIILVEFLCWSNEMLIKHNIKKIMCTCETVCRPIKQPLNSNTIENALTLWSDVSSFHFWSRSSFTYNLMHSLHSLFLCSHYSQMNLNRSHNQMLYIWSRHLTIKIRKIKGKGKTY